MVSKDDIMGELVRTNYWWETGSVRALDLEEYRRNMFTDLVDALEDKEICGIIGARRTGKTTLMYQLIDLLLERGVEPKNIMLFTFDNPLMCEDEGVIEKIVHIHEEIYGITDKRYIFFDEIQYVKDWSRWIKSIYDKNMNIKFVVSGSSGKLIYKNTSESLTGRISFFETDSFSFGEYCCYKGSEGLKSFLEGLDDGNSDPLTVDPYELNLKIKHHEKELKRLFNDYILYGGIPETFDKELSKAHKWLRQDYVGLVFYRDLMELFDIRDTRTLEELFYYIANTHGQRANYSKIGDMLDCRIETVKTYLGYLEIAGLINIIEYYSKSPKRSKRAEKKLFVLDSGVLNAIKGNDKKILTYSAIVGSIVEGIVCSHLVSGKIDILPKNVYYWRSVYEVDFVVKERDGLIPIEVKYKNNVGESDLKGLISFMEKHNIEEGIVITKEKFEETIIDNNKIWYIPVWFFLLKSYG